MAEKKELGERREDRKPYDVPAPGPDEEQLEDREAGMLDGMIPL